MHVTFLRVDVFSHLLFWIAFLSCSIYGNPLVCLDHFKCEISIEKTTVACSDPGIDVVPLCLNPSLVYLTLQNTRIHTLYLTSFRYYAYLKYVNLSHNKISKIEKKTFENQHNLEELHLANNKLAQLDPEIFVGLQNLTILSLHGNLLEEIPEGALHQLTNLEHLDLSHNRLTTLNEETFNGLSKLIILSLAQNKLTSIPGNSFTPIPHLSELVIGGNLFNKIEPHDFNSLKNLDSLDLSDTSLKENLTLNTFHYVSGLRTLILDNCHLEYVPTTALNGLSQLEEVYLSRNHFIEISKDAFRGNPRLTSLVITGCPELQRISAGALKNNLNLKKIDLSRNPNLTYLPSSEFKSLTKLSHLDLHSNNLQYIPSDLVSWEEVNIWFLHYNPIACNCSSAWLRKLLIESNSTAVKCATPKELEGESLAATDLGDLRCGLDSTTQGVIIAFSIFILLILIGCFVVFILYRHRDPCVRRLLKGKKWERKGRNPSHRSYDSDYPCIKPVPVTEL